MIFLSRLTGLPQPRHSGKGLQLSCRSVLQASIEHAKAMRYCAKGDCVVALHRIGNASVIKIVDVY